MTMPRVPKGERRAADVIGDAVHVMRIATGEIEDVTTDDGRNALPSRCSRSRTYRLHGIGVAVAAECELDAVSCLHLRKVDARRH